MFQFAMLNKQMVYDSYWKFMEQIIGKSWEDSKILEDRGFIRKNLGYLQNGMWRS